MNRVIHIENLSRSFGDLVAVDRVSLQVDPGQILGYLGPNGAGKSTTLRLLTGFLRPSAGSATICGHDVVRESMEVKRVTGFVPDAPQLFEHLSALDYLRLVSEVHGLGSQSAERAAELLRRLGLRRAATRPMGEYSFGMRKKTALIAALLPRPLCLLLDEPTAGLDPAGTRIVEELMREEAERGVSVMLSTHFLDSAQRLCHKIAVLHGGRLLAEGPPASLARYRAAQENGDGASGETLEPALGEAFRRLLEEQDEVD